VASVPIISLKVILREQAHPVIPSVHPIWFLFDILYCPFFFLKLHPHWASSIVLLILFLHHLLCWLLSFSSPHIINNLPVHNFDPFLISWLTSPGCSHLDTGYSYLRLCDFQILSSWSKNTHWSISKKPKFILYPQTHSLFCKYFCPLSYPYCCDPVHPASLLRNLGLIPNIVLSFKPHIQLLNILILVKQILGISPAVQPYLFL
jgi:hypothetical protein